MTEPDLCPGCDAELPTDQFCQGCECFGWEHCIITLDQAREWFIPCKVVQLPNGMHRSIPLEDAA
jgi:hypothetical protein